MCSQLYGTNGRILRVNLDTEETGSENLDESALHNFLGGTAMGVKYLYEEVDPVIKWSDSQNRIYLGSGPLGGTKIAGSGCFSVVTKGTMTNGVTSSQANGFFGAYLKFAGFDGILIQGEAPDWKYLYVHDGVAELKNARHLVGQDTWETEVSIKKELEQFGISTMEAAVLFVIQIVGRRATSAEIARWLFREPHSTVGYINRMEKKGLVRRVRDLNKKNQIRIAMTRKGRQVFAQSEKTEEFKRIFNRLSEEERQQLGSLLEKVLDATLKELAIDRRPPYP
ncbi:aldehyde ferredoxin oxidoreductase N-terminal domain-containing protein [Chloroflexota bacterium]